MVARCSGFPVFLLAILLTSFSLLFFAFQLLTLLFFLAVCVRIFLEKSRQLTLLTGIFLLIFSGRFLYEKHTQVDRSAFLTEHAELSKASVNVQPDSIQVDGDLLSFTGTYLKKKWKCYYTLKTEKEQRYFQTNTKNLTLSVKATLGKGTPQRNVDGFDYDLFLTRAHLSGVMQIQTIQAVNEKERITIFSLRRKAIVHVRTHFSYPLNEYMNGLLFGELSKNFEESKEIYRNLGVLHLFALSGMQVSFFLAKFRKILLRMGVTIEKTTFLKVLFSVFYLGMTGFSLSVLRAVLQENIKESAKLFGIEWQAQQVFGVVVILSLWIEPYLFLNVSGQLSYFLGLLLLFMREITRNMKGKMRKELVFGILLSIGIAPLLWRHFYASNPLSIPFTMLLGAFFDSFLLPVLSLSFALSFVISTDFLNAGMHYFEEVMRFFNARFQFNWCIGRPSDGVFVLMLLSVFFVFASFEKRKGKMAFLGLVSLGVLAFFTHIRPIGMVAMVDVGQGDSIFIQEPFSKKVTLIDVGGRREIRGKERWQLRHATSNAEKTLIPYLLARGVRAVDEMYLTHAHEDHYGDVLRVAEAIPIKKVYIPKNSWQGTGFRRTLQTLQKNGTQIEEILAPKQVDETTLCLSPQQVTDGGNNDSLVLLKTIGKARFLFTGDCEKEGEEILLKTYPSFTVDVLKVGHHGSTTSTTDELLHQINPKIALISCGVDNQFHHPNKEIVEKLEKKEIMLYRTDKNGMIYFKWYPWNNQLTKAKVVRK